MYTYYKHVIFSPFYLTNDITQIAELRNIPPDEVEEEFNQLRRDFTNIVGDEDSLAQFIHALSLWNDIPALPTDLFTTYTVDVSGNECCAKNGFLQAFLLNKSKDYAQKGFFSRNYQTLTDLPLMIQQTLHYHQQIQNNQNPIRTTSSDGDISVSYGLFDAINIVNWITLPNGDIKLKSIYSLTERAKSVVNTEKSFA